MLLKLPRILYIPGLRHLSSEVAHTTIGPANQQKTPADNKFLVSGVARTQRTFTAEDALRFARLTGDRNAIHVDESAARRHGFARCVVHGALINGLVSGLIAASLPNCVVAEQVLRFPNPLLVDEPVSVQLDLVQHRKRLVSVKYTCTTSTPPREVTEDLRQQQLQQDDREATAEHRQQPVSTNKVVMHGEAKLALPIVSNGAP